MKRAAGNTEAAAALAAAGPDREVAGVMLTPADLAPAWRSPVPVLCVSSRGPFDEAATLMLSQTLDRHGLRSEVMAMADIRAGARPKDVDGLALICFSYLEPVSLSQIRFTVRQARIAVPGVRVLVGFWRERDPATLDRLRRATSADFLATTLNDAIESAVNASRATRGPSAQPAAAPASPLPQAAA